MGAIAFQITSLTIVYATVYSDTDQRKCQSSSSLAFVTGEFPAQMVSNTENISIWWRHHDLRVNMYSLAMPLLPPIPYMIYLNHIMFHYEMSMLQLSIFCKQWPFYFVMSFCSLTFYVFPRASSSRVM